MSNNNQNIQTPKPSLLPLEYCTVERAAEMLRVKIDDIHHWCDIGSINFYYLFEQPVDVEGVIYPDIDVDTSLIEFIEQCNENAIPIDIYSMWLSASHESKRSTLAWSSDDWSTDTDGPINIKGSAKGLWLLTRSARRSRITNILYMNNKGNNKINVDIWLPDLNVERSVYLIREDLIRLYGAIYKGESLPNRYNSEEIRQQLKEQEKQADNQPTRVRSEHVVLTQELVKRVLNIDTIDQPSKQAEVLWTELSSTIPVEDLPSVRSITRYLGGK
jgi:hypothetical protein